MVMNSVLTGVKRKYNPKFCIYGPDHREASHHCDKFGPDRRVHKNTCFEQFLGFAHAGAFSSIIRAFQVVTLFFFYHNYTPQHSVEYD